LHALLQELANLFTKRAVHEHALVRLKLWPVGPAEWPILISDTDTAIASVLDVSKTRLHSALCRDSFVDVLKFQDPLLDHEDGI